MYELMEEYFTRKLEQGKIHVAIISLTTLCSLIELHKHFLWFRNPKK
jgi:hypothetical protein